VDESGSPPAPENPLENLLISGGLHANSSVTSHFLSRAISSVAGVIQQQKHQPHPVDQPAHEADG
jgi:hypothetical protein